MEHPFLQTLTSYSVKWVLIPEMGMNNFIKVKIGNLMIRMALEVLRNHSYERGTSRTLPLVLPLLISEQYIRILLHHYCDINISWVDLWDYLLWGHMWVNTAAASVNVLTRLKQKQTKPKQNDTLDFAFTI